MKRCGKLKTMAELKAFWEQMLTPLQSPKHQHGQFPVSGVWVDKELERMEEETNSWAITASKHGTNVREQLVPKVQSAGTQCPNWPDTNGI